MLKTMVIGIAIVAAGVAVAQTGAVTNKQAAEKAPAFSTIGPGKFQSFIKNWDEKTDKVLYALIQSSAQWDLVFHPAPVMGGKREFGPDKAQFEKEQLVVLARVMTAPEGDASSEVFSIESVGVTNGELTVRYQFSEPKSKATWSMKSFIGVWVPKAEYTSVVLIENGKEIGKLEPAKGTWSVPAMKKEKE